MIKDILEIIRKNIENFEEEHNDVFNLKERLNSLRETANEVNESWSQSWIGFHANLYYEDFQKPSWEKTFNSEWGSLNGIPDYWKEKDYDEVEEYIENNNVGIGLNEIGDRVNEAIVKISKIKNKVTTELTIIEGKEKYESEWEEVVKFKDYQWGTSPRKIIQHRKPEQIMSRDTKAIQQGIVTPPHIMYDSSLISLISKIDSIEEFLEKTKMILRKIEIKNENYFDDSNNLDDEFHVDKILNICKKFYNVARQLRSRYSNRETIKIEDEYDAQDLFHALLKLYFDDIREEEWNPSYAGSSTRSDFLLKNEKLILELKKTRESMTDKDLGEQLIIDIAKYKSHPDSKILICFVYDPEGRIGNPYGIESDLNELTSEEMKVITVIEPK